MEILFWTMAVLVGWCFVGYPAVMFARAARRPDGVDQQGDEPAPAASCVLAVRNAEDRINRRVTNLLQQEGVTELEVLVVCNGCTDRTEERARRLADDDPRVKVLVSPADEGKAGAINKGVAAAVHPYIVFADVRQDFRPDAVRSLIRGFDDPAVGVVTGQTVTAEASTPSIEGVGVYWGFETRLRLAESKTGSTVQAQGAIYAIHRELFVPIPPNTILDDVYLPMRIAMQGYRIAMRPDAIAFDEPAAEQEHEYRRKLRTMTGNLQLLRLLPSVLSPTRNPVFFRFVSHKLLRVLTPVFLIAMLVIGSFLPLVPYGLIVIAQLTFYAAGVIGLYVHHRWLGIPAAFVLVHAALIHALVRPDRDARTVWTRSDEKEIPGDP